MRHANLTIDYKRKLRMRKILKVTIDDKKKLKMHEILT